MWGLRKASFDNLPAITATPPADSAEPPPSQVARTGSPSPREAPYVAASPGRLKAPDALQALPAAPSSPASPHFPTSASSPTPSSAPASPKVPGKAVSEPAAPQKPQALPHAVEEVLNEIRDVWDVMASDTFNPVPFALSLMEPRARRDLEQFEAFEAKLEAAMDEIVNEYHGAFNASIHTFSVVVDKIKDAQMRVKTAQRALLESRSALPVQHQNLLDVWVQMRQYKDMLRILDLIEEVRQAPYRIHVLLHAHRHLAATRQWLRASKLLDHREVEGVGALANIRRELVAIGDSMHESAIEALHHHIYFRAPQNLARSAAVSLFKGAAPRTPRARVFMSAASINAPASENLASDALDVQDEDDADGEATSAVLIQRILLALILQGRVRETVQALAHRLPIELFYLVEQTIHDHVRERDAALGERTQARPQTTTAALAKRVADPGSASSVAQFLQYIGLCDIEEQGEQIRAVIARVFERLESVLRSHVLVFETLRANWNRAPRETEPLEQLCKTAKYTMPRVWVHVRDEVRGLLGDLLQPSGSAAPAAGDSSVARQTMAEPSSLLNASGAAAADFAALLARGDRHERGETVQHRTFFRLAPDQKPIPAVEAASGELVRVGGATRKLIAAASSFATNANSQGARFATTSASDKVTATSPLTLPQSPTLTFPERGMASAEDGLGHGLVRSGVSTSHTQIADPSPFLVTLFHGATLEFSDRMQALGSVEPDAEHDQVLKRFLDDHVDNAFLPALEEKVLQYFMEFVSGEDAFAPLRVNAGQHTVDSLPLQKSTLALIHLARGLAHTTTLIPMHRSELADMFELCLLKYFEKCFTRTRALLISDETDGANVISSTWVEHEDIVRVLAQSRLLYEAADDAATLETVATDPQRPFRQFLASEETRLELELKRDRSFHHSELLFDLKKMAALAHMHHSLEILAAAIQSLLEPAVTPRSLAAMQAGNDDDGGSATKEYSKDALLPSPIVMEAIDDAGDDGDAAAATAVNAGTDTLALSDAQRARVGALLANLASLSSMCIYVLHIEVRTHAMYYIDLAAREGNYKLDEPPSEPDQYVLSLNQDLVACEQALVGALPTKKVQFVLDGIASLLGFLLVHNVRQLRALSSYGLVKMQRNIVALQHNLINLGTPVDPGTDAFARAERFYALFDRSGPDVLRTLELDGPRYDPSEYRQVLQLLYGPTLAEHELLQAAEDEAGEADGVPVVLDLDPFRPQRVAKQLAEYTLLCQRLDEYFVRNSASVNV